MSGISTSQPFGILNANNRGIELNCYGTMLELAEAAAYRVWRDLGGPEQHIAWLRAMADKFEAQWEAEAEPDEDPAMY